jgi:hypothetical protein
LQFTRLVCRVAELGSLGDFVDMHVNRIISRDRRVPGRATGYVFFTLRWPSGELSQRCPHSTRLDHAIRLFTDRLRLVPLPERELATAHLDAQVRLAQGGVRRAPLASWSGTQPLPEFFRAARQAWKQIPKEYEDQKRQIPDDIDVA